MTEKFKGILNFHENAFHAYTTDDPKSFNLGIGSYTYESIKKFSEDPAYKDNFDANGGPLKLSSIRGTDQDIDVYYYKYLSSSNKYTKTILADKFPIKDLIEKHEEMTAYPADAGKHADEAEVIKEIRNSLNGCLEWEYNENTYKLWFLTLQNADNSRILVSKGDPLISSVPRRSTGAKYDFKETVRYNENATSDNDSKNLGYYATFSNQEQMSYKSQVAGNLRLSYNKALSKYESGSQCILARLMTPLDAASIQEIDFSAIDNVTPKDLYDPESNFYMSHFKVGFALPLTVHNGNPHTCGPNMIGDPEGYKKEKIRVINRSSRKFTRGDLVLCTLIDNEWIAQDFGEATIEPATVKVGKWQFQKFLANSDCYFKDDRWAASNDDDTDYRANITESAYAIDRRKDYYYHYNSLNAAALSMDGVNNISLIANLNHFPSNSLATLQPLSKAEISNLLGPFSGGAGDMKPSRKYIQTSAFDQVSSSLCGNNSHTILGRTNIFQNPDTTSISVFAERIDETACFWGPIFPDGYSTSKALSMKAQGTTGNVKGLSGFLTAGTVQINDNDSIVASGRPKMFQNANDFNLFQLPAEIALNAPLDGGEYGYPIESISLLAQKESQADITPYVYKNYLGDERRYSYLHQDTDGKVATFDLEPVQPSRVLFMPLSWTWAGHSDQNSIDVDDQYDAYTDTRNVLAEDYRDQAHYWGKMFSREKDLTNADLVATDYGGFAGEEGVKLDFDNVPWDRYIRKQPNQEVSSTYAFADNDSRGSKYNGANLVGIVAGKNTVRVGGLATLSFSTTFSYGLPKWTSVTGFSPSVSILPIGGGLVLGGGSSTIKTFGFRQWGPPAAAESSSPSSFGSSALHIRVFDHWPHEDTIYDGRYFTPLHFNPGVFESIAASQTFDEGKQFNGAWNPSELASNSVAATAYQRDVDTAEHTSDFRIPTYGDPRANNIDNSVVEEGMYINRIGVTTSNNPDPEQTENLLRPKEEWRVNTICRGTMVTQDHGFFHFRRSIGLTEQQMKIVNAGSGFNENEEFILDKNVRIVYEGGNFVLKDRGFGFLPPDFSRVVEIEGESYHGYEVTLRKGEVGEDAVLLFQLGYVYDRISETNYPKFHGNVAAVDPSDGDRGVITGSKTTTIGIKTPNSTGLYDVFVYCVNDVSNVDQVSTPQTAGYTQYIELNLGAG